MHQLCTDLFPCGFQLGSANASPALVSWLLYKEAPVCAMQWDPFKSLCGRVLEITSKYFSLDSLNTAQSFKGVSFEG